MSLIRNVAHVEVFCVLALFMVTGPVPHCEAQLASLKVADGYRVEVAASSDLIAHPLMADFDEHGNLYVAANCGQNLPRVELEARLPNFIKRLSDLDGDGVFDSVTTFADQLTFPQGCLWHEGALYVASSGAIWKLVDTDQDGVADQRTKLVGDFGYTGNAADVHGPFLGPEGRMYWCEGRHGHKITDRQGQVISQGKAARIFSSKFDGSDVQSYCTGGMDNPVEILFTPEGDMLGTVNLMYARPRGDCLVHWQFGGVYPREDFASSLDGEFIRTGDLLSEVHNFGHVAVSGLCQINGPSMGPDLSGRLLITQFNTNRVVSTTLESHLSSFKVARNQDFLVSESKDFHPTDVLQAPDGSLLVIDTGGWFRIGCPQSQLAKPDIRGAIYRIRPITGKANALPSAAQLNDPPSDPPSDQISNQGTSPSVQQIWKAARSPNTTSERELAAGLQSSDSSVSQAAARALLNYPSRPEQFAKPLADLIRSGAPTQQRVAAASYPNHVADPSAATQILLQRIPEADDRLVRHALIDALIRVADRPSLAAAMSDESAAIREAAAIALEQLRRASNLPKTDWLHIPPASQGTVLTEAQQTELLAIEAALPSGEVSSGQKLFVSQQIACAKCHQVHGQGGLVGPDLSTIGRSRSQRDLLEAIRFPSASFARGFAPYSVLATDGQVIAGIILAEGVDFLQLGVDQQSRRRVEANEIESIQAGRVSIMPDDLHQQLSPQELADLLAYLKSLQ